MNEQLVKLNSDLDALRIKPTAEQLAEAGNIAGAKSIEVAKTIESNNNTAESRIDTVIVNAGLQSGNPKLGQVTSEILDGSTDSNSVKNGWFNFGTLKLKVSPNKNGSAHSLGKMLEGVN